MNKNLIYDIGLHHGKDTGFYLKKGFRVVAVDANPENIERARNKCAAELDAGRLTLVNAAITDIDGAVRTFYVPKDQWIRGQSMTVVSIPRRSTNVVKRSLDLRKSRTMKTDLARCAANQYGIFLKDSSKSSALPAGRCVRNASPAVSGGKLIVAR